MVMRTIGNRKIPDISLKASGELLKVGCLFNDEIHKLPTGNKTFIPKGIYRFKSMEEMDEFDKAALAKGMAQIVKERRHG